MNDEQLTKIWGVIALTLLFYVLNTWISSQGAQPILDLDLLDSRRVPGALIALIICPPLLALAAGIGSLYFARHGEDNAWSAVPTPGIGALDPTSTEARIYIVAQLFFVYVLPMFSFVHFLRIVLSAEVCAREPDLPNLSVWSLPELSRLNSGYRLDGWDATAMRCTGGVTFWPLLEPILLLAWTVIPIVLVGRYAWKLSRRRSR